MQLNDHTPKETRRIEPEITRIIGETFTNEWDPVQARVTDQAMLRPIPAPGGRLARIRYAFTLRKWGLFDNRLMGSKVDIPAQANPDHLQAQTAYEAYSRNTFRTEPRPWDETLTQ